MTKITTSVTSSSGRSFTATIENKAPVVTVSVLDKKTLGVSISGRGPQGAMGESAYEIWLGTGQTGTEQDFINSLIPEASQTYTHDQIAASAVWEILHNLSRLPSVTIVDSSGNVVVGDIVYTDKNSLSISFTSAFSGKAYLN